MSLKCHKSSLYPSWLSALYFVVKATEKVSVKLTKCHPSIKLPLTYLSSQCSFCCLSSGPLVKSPRVIQETRDSSEIVTQWHHTSYNSNEFQSHVQRPALTVNFKPTKFCFCRNMICCKTLSRFFSIMMDLCKCAVLPPVHLQCFYNIHFSDFWKAEFVVHFMVFCETNSIFQHLPSGSAQANRQSRFFTLSLQMIWSLH